MGFNTDTCRAPHDICGLCWAHTRFVASRKPVTVSLYPHHHPCTPPESYCQRRATGARQGLTVATLVRGGCACEDAARTEGVLLARVEGDVLPRGRAGDSHTSSACGDDRGNARRRVRPAASACRKKIRSTAEVPARASRLGWLETRGDPKGTRSSASVRAPGRDDVRTLYGPCRWASCTSSSTPNTRTRRRGRPAHRAARR